MFFPGHFTKDKNKLILPGIQVLWWIKKIQNRLTFQKIQLFYRTSRLTACQFAKNKKERNHSPRMQVITTNKYPQIWEINLKRMKAGNKFF